MNIKEQRNLLFIIVLGLLLLLLSNMVSFKRSQDKWNPVSIVYKKEGSHLVWENTLPYSDGGKINRLTSAYSSTSVDFDDSILPDYIICCEFGTLNGDPAPPWFEGDTVYPGSCRNLRRL